MLKQYLTPKLDIVSDSFNTHVWMDPMIFWHLSHANLRREKTAFGDGGVEVTIKMVEMVPQLIVEVAFAF